MSRLWSSDGRIRPPARVVGLMMCSMMTIWSLVVVGVTQASSGFSALAWVVWAGWLAFMWYFVGWPALKGCEHQWVNELYYATLGRLLGDYKLKK